MRGLWYAVFFSLSVAALGSPASTVEMVRPPAKPGDVMDLAMDPAGRFAVTAHERTDILIWSLPAGVFLRALPSRVEYPCVSIHPTESWLAACDDEAINIWNIETGTLLRRLPQDGRTELLRWSSDGKLLAARTKVGGALAATVEVLDIRDWSVLHRFPTGMMNVNDRRLVFAFGERVLYCADGMGAAGWDLASGAPVPLPAGISGIAANRDLLALASPNAGLWLTPSPDLRTKDTLIAVESFRPGTGADGPIAISSDGKRLFTAARDRIRVFDLATRKELEPVRMAASSDEIELLEVSGPDDQIVLVSRARWGHGSFLTGRRSEGVLGRWIDTSGDLYLRIFGFSADGELQVLDGLDGEPGTLWTLGDQTREESLDGTARERAEMRLLGRPCRNDLGNIRIPAEDGDVVLKVSGGTPSDPFSCSADGRFIAFVQHDPEEPRSIPMPSHIDPQNGTVSIDADSLAAWQKAPNPSICVLDTSTQESRKLELPGIDRVSRLFLSPDGRRLAMLLYPREISDKPGFLRVWSPFSDGAVHEKEFHADLFGFAPDGRIAAQGYKALLLFAPDLSGEPETIALDETPTAVAFDRSSQTIVFSPGDNEFQIVRGSHTLATVDFQHTEGETVWLAYTSAGLFDGPEAGWHQFLWRFDNQTFRTAPVDSFFQALYEPGLIGRALSGQVPSPPMAIEKMDLAAPSVQVSATPSGRPNEFQVKVTAEPGKPGGLAKDVRLFRGGALVKSWNGVQTDSQHPRLEFETLMAVTGGSTRISAYAFNADNVKSADAAVEIEGDPRKQHAGILYVVSVGVNQYRNPALNLRFAEADARLLEKGMLEQAGREVWYRSVKSTLLVNDGAGKAAILKALADAGAAARPEDAVVFFFAGHGLRDGGSYYLLPHDQKFSGPAQELTASAWAPFAASGISDRDLETVFEPMQAGQIVAILDSCSSGQAMKVSDDWRRGPLNAHGLAQLVYEKGILMLAAAQSDQSALELSQLGHGLLTYALVEEGLQHREAFQKKATLDFYGWLHWAADRVPNLDAAAAEKSKERGFPLERPEGFTQRPALMYHHSTAGPWDTPSAGLAPEATNPLSGSFADDRGRPVVRLPWGGEPALILAWGARCADCPAEAAKWERESSARIPPGVKFAFVVVLGPSSGGSQISSIAPKIRAAGLRGPVYYLRGGSDDLSPTFYVGDRKGVLVGSPEWHDGKAFELLDLAMKDK